MRLPLREPPRRNPEDVEGNPRHEHEEDPEDGETQEKRQESCAAMY